MLERVAVVGGSVTPSQDVILSRSEVQALISASVAPLLSRISVLEARLNQSVLDGLAAEQSLALGLASERSQANQQVGTETSRAVVAETALGNTVSMQVGQLAASAAQISATAVSDRARTREVDAALNSTQISTAAALALETSRAVSIETVLSGAIVTEMTRATLVEASLGAALGLETVRALAGEASVALAVVRETSRAVGIETALSTAISLEASRAITAETLEASTSRTAERSLATATSAAAAAVVQETSRALDAVGVLNASIFRETSRVQAAATAEPNRAVAVESSIASSIAAGLSTAAARNAYSELVNPGSTYTAVPFSCSPTVWATNVGPVPGTAGCSVTLTLTGPSIIVATLAGFVQTVPGINHQYTGISINGDNDLTTDPCCAMPGVAVYGPSLSLGNTLADNHRTSRTRFLANAGSVTIAARFLTGTASITYGYALSGMVITTPLSTVGLAGTYMCASNLWSTQINSNAATPMCTVPFYLPFASLVYSFLGGHQRQFTTTTVTTLTAGTFGWIGYDGLNQGSQTVAQYAGLSAAFSQPSAVWAPFNSGRTTTLSRGLHNATMNFFAATQAGNSFFNGGGMQGLFIPLDTSISVPQTFSCSISGTTSLGLTATSLCATTITLPYRAVVWADFTVSIRNLAVANAWIGASISFNNDADAAITAMTQTALLPFGFAHSYSQSAAMVIGQGRTIVLNAGTQTIAVAARASGVGGQVTGLGMSGFFVRALPGI
eukprot:m.185778 g.185778  ORF g.185778 m.185778 type:complete len:735 (-) comp15403_c0_seq3:167-2371(-)